MLTVIGRKARGLYNASKFSNKQPSPFDRSVYTSTMITFEESPHVLPKVLIHFCILLAG